MEEISAIKYEEKKSRFYAHLYRITDERDLEVISEIHRTKYRKAAHHCVAARFTDRSGNFHEEFKNDGEVGHPAKVMLRVMEVNGLDSHAVVVSRLFGRIKLGPGGVSRAFRKSAEYVISEAGE
jgi:putative IMPACT (imprinted ancient) family translation regulator